MFAGATWIRAWVSTSISVVSRSTQSPGSLKSSSFFRVKGSRNLAIVSAVMRSKNIWQMMCCVSTKKLAKAKLTGKNNVHPPSAGAVQRSERRMYRYAVVVVARPTCEAMVRLHAEEDRKSKHRNAVSNMRQNRFEGQVRYVPGRDELIFAQNYRLGMT